MTRTEKKSDGVFDSFRRVGRSVVGLMHTRVELFAVDLQEEKIRAIRLIAWFAAAVALGTAGLLVSIATLAVLLWRTTGYAGLVGLALGALSAGAGILWAIHRQIAHGPIPFAATVAEFRKDAESFQTHA